MLILPSTPAPTPAPQETPPAPARSNGIIARSRSPKKKGQVYLVIYASFPFFFYFSSTPPSSQAPDSTTSLRLRIYVIWLPRVAISIFVGVAIPVSVFVPVSTEQTALLTHTQRPISNSRLLSLPTRIPHQEIDGPCEASSEGLAGLRRREVLDEGDNYDALACLCLKI
jgi:hypothetical protein